MTPEVLIAASSACAAAPALRRTRSPSMRPLFVTLPSPSTAIRTRPSPARSMVLRVPPASATVPRRATMTPAFSTWSPTSAASPASPTVMRPSLATRAPLRVPLPIDSRPSRWNRPASIAWLVATSPPTSTRAVPVKSTPAPFWMMTVPGARIAPSITLGRAVSTRLSVAALRPGWPKTTWWSRPTSKPRQSITARSEVCRIAVRPGVWTIRALPPTTVPPSGPPAGAASASMSASSDAPSIARSRAGRGTPRGAGDIATRDYMSKDSIGSCISQNCEKINRVVPRPAEGRRLTDDLRHFGRPSSALSHGRGV